MKVKEQAEIEKLHELVEGLRVSRATTVDKLISLVRKLHERGLWLTYISAEAADENLRTPRRPGVNDSQIKRGARTSARGVERWSMDRSVSNERKMTGTINGSRLLASEGRKSTPFKTPMQSRSNYQLRLSSKPEVP